MEVEPTKAAEMRDQDLNDALDTHSTEELDGLSIQNLRLARIQEYEEVAVERLDPFAAVIGMGNAYLQRIFEHLGAAMLEELDDRPHTLEEFRELRPDIRLLVKLRSAIETDLALQPPVGGPQAAALSKSTKSKGIDAKATTSSRKMVLKRWTGGS